MNLKLRLLICVMVFFGIGILCLILSSTRKLSFIVSSQKESAEIVDELNGPGVNQLAQHVIRTLQTKFLESGSNSDGSGSPYNLTLQVVYSEEESQDWSRGQAAYIRKLFNGFYEKDGLETGFFIEAGALDGETGSNTLYLEKHLGWNGLLIEADPKNFAKMRLKQRKNSILSNTCLSPDRHPMKVSFEQRRSKGRIAEGHVPGEHIPKHVDVQCFPFVSFMKALNRSRVDYLSLDVEGSELLILKTIPFSYYDVRTLSVDVEYLNDLEVREFMEGQGYFVFTKVTHPRNWANDFIFVKESFFDTQLKPEVQEELIKIIHAFENIEDE